MPHSTIDDQGIFISRAGARQALTYGVILIVALVCIAWFNARNPQPTAPNFYYPEPTPYVNRVDVNIFSKNCIGWSVTCNNGE